MRGPRLRVAASCQSCTRGRGKGESWEQLDPTVFRGGQCGSLCLLLGTSPKLTSWRQPMGPEEARECLLATGQGRTGCCMRADLAAALRANVRPALVLFPTSRCSRSFPPAINAQL